MRIYIKNGEHIGAVGYTDLKLSKTGKLELFSTEGAEYDFYDNDTDTHYPIKYDMDGNTKTNKNFGRMYYEKD